MFQRQLQTIALCFPQVCIALHMQADGSAEALRLPPPFARLQPRRLAAAEGGGMLLVLAGGAARPEGTEPSSPDNHDTLLALQCAPTSCILHAL